MEVGDGKKVGQARHNDERMRPWSTARRRVSGSAHAFVLVTPSAYGWPGTGPKTLSNK